MLGRSGNAARDSIRIPGFFVAPLTGNADPACGYTTGNRIRRECPAYEIVHA
jgi:hypothetical protein